MSKRLARRRRPMWLWLAACLACLSALAAPTDPSQREAFRQAYAAAQQGGDSWRGWSAQLQSYPLYPYLEAAALSHDLRQLNLAQVQDYLNRYPEWIPAADLRRDFLYELARRQDWTGFRTLYRPGLGDALTCDALQAQLAAAQPLDFNRDLAALWDKPSLPDSCDPVLNAAHNQGLLTTERLWARIERAANAGQPGTIATLAAWLPVEQMPSAQHLAGAARSRRRRQRRADLAGHRTRTSGRRTGLAAAGTSPVRQRRPGLAAIADALHLQQRATQCDRLRAGAVSRHRLRRQRADPADRAASGRAD
jgi:soluble lytic murein transglycosylase